MVAKTQPTVYDAWQFTLAPFLVPACVLSAWPVFMIVCASNRTPLKLLCILALASLADGLLGSCAYPLLHQYAFTPAQNNALFYAGSVCYWLSGLVLGPVMEVWGTRKSLLALSASGVLGAVWSAQSLFVCTVLGRCLSATATSGVTTLVEYALYDEAHLRRGCGNEVSSFAGQGDRDEHQQEKERGAHEGTAESLGGGMLTMCHQLRPLTLWASMLLGQYTMVFTPHISTGPCWAAAGCYLMALLMAWKVLPTWTAGEALKLTSRLRVLSSSAASTEVERCLSGLAPPKSGSSPFSASAGEASSSSAAAASAGLSMDAPAVQRWLRCFAGSYAISVKTLLQPQYLARHLVDILFGGLFLVMSLLWVPTLEIYDDSIPFGFIFQIFMIARFLGSTFSLPAWAVGWAEAALVALLSVTARILNTSRDYAIPVTIMLAGVAMHLVAGVTQTTGSLWRAEYPSAAAPLTFLFVLRALTGISGWVFLNMIDGHYMEDVFVVEARWVYGLMWIEAVALAQYIARRAAQHRGAAHLHSSSGVRVMASGVKEDSLRDDGASAREGFAATTTAAVNVGVEIISHHLSGGSPTGTEHRAFKS